MMMKYKNRLPVIVRNVKALRYRGLVVLALAMSICVPANADDTSNALRQLIPTPQQCSLDTGVLPVVTGGKANLVILAPENAEPKETMAAEWVEREIAKFAGVTPKIATGGAGIASGDSNTQLVFATYSRETKNLKQVVGLLDEADRAVLSDRSDLSKGMSFVVETIGWPLWAVRPKAHSTAP